MTDPLRPGAPERSAERRHAVRRSAGLGRTGRPGPIAGARLRPTLPDVVVPCRSPAEQFDDPPHQLFPSSDIYLNEPRFRNRPRPARTVWERAGRRVSGRGERGSADGTLEERGPPPPCIPRTPLLLVAFERAPPLPPLPLCGEEGGCDRPPVPLPTPAACACRRSISFSSRLQSCCLACLEACPGRAGPSRPPLLPMHVLFSLRTLPQVTQPVRSAPLSLAQ